MLHVHQNTLGIPKKKNNHEAQHATVS